MPPHGQERADVERIDSCVEEPFAFMSWSAFIVVVESHAGASKALFDEE